LKKDGRQKQVDIQIKLSTEPPPPVLLRNVRVLDFKTGSFTEATSLFVAAGRIEWIGAEAGHTLPSDLTVVDSGGRFAIPGLFDMHAHADGREDAQGLCRWCQCHNRSRARRVS
jgi:predicted amidohydrolase YtcJ